MSRQPVLVVDIGGTKIACGIAYPDGRIETLRRELTLASEGGEAVLTRTIALLRGVRQANGIALSGIGVGTAGDVDPENGTITYATATIPNWTGIALRERIQSALGLPTFVDNDGNVMALGEAVFGAGRGHADLLGITIGTGIGGGIVIGGRIYHGAYGTAGRIGHIIVDYEERQPCTCGGFGCLEAYASAPPLVAAFVQSLGAERILRELALDAATLGVKEIAGLAAAGHRAAQDVIARGALFLGIGISSLLNLLNPELVIVGGGVAQIGESYLKQVRQVVARRAQGPVKQTPISPALLGPEANLLGAAELAWQGMQA